MAVSLRDRLGIDFPLFAFSHCRDVVAAVSKAGGFGVFGAVSSSPQEREVELSWIDEHVDGRPYGVNLIYPEKVVGRDLSREQVAASIPAEHRDFVVDLLRRHDVALDPAALASHEDGLLNLRSEERVNEMLDVAFSHPIGLIANALGVPPKHMIEMGRAHSVPVAALVGSKHHAMRQAAAGVDIIIAQGTEAAGHCGEISTLVLVPEVVRALRDDYPEVPVLAAGGVATGEQMAACIAAGAAGVWTGSVWLTTAEAETAESIKDKLIAAGSSDTVRSRGRTGKPARQLRSAWTDAWEDAANPRPLPMPLQALIAEPALRKVEALADKGHDGACRLNSYFVGQGVGLIDSRLSARQVVANFREGCADAVIRLTHDLM
jgi:NAD(P)H-dependent flavin oxidoreductase YrpB (nitropropane dioxygenase family)